MDALGLKFDKYSKFQKSGVTYFSCSPNCPRVSITRWTISYLFVFLVLFTYEAMTTEYLLVPRVQKWRVQLAYEKWKKNHNIN